MFSSALSASFVYLQCMLWVYGHCKHFNSFSAGVVFIRQNLTSAYVKLWRLKTTCCVKDGILVQVTINRRLLIGRDGHLDQSEAYDSSLLVREYRGDFYWQFYILPRRRINAEWRWPSVDTMCLAQCAHVRYTYGWLLWDCFQDWLPWIRQQLTCQIHATFPGWCGH